MISNENYDFLTRLCLINPFRTVEAHFLKYEITESNLLRKKNILRTSKDWAGKYL